MVWAVGSNKISQKDNSKLTWVLFSGKDASRRASMLAVDIPVVFLRSSLSWSTFLNTSLNFSGTNSQRTIDVTAFSRHTANLKHTEKTWCEVWKCGTSLLRKTSKKTWNTQSLLSTFYSLVCGLKLSHLWTAKFAQMERLGAFFVNKQTTLYLNRF